MGSVIKFQLVIAIVLLSAVIRIDAVLGSGVISPGTQSSHPDSESAYSTKHRRSAAVGAAATGQTGSQSLCNKQGCSCLDQPILTIDCEVYDQLTLEGQYHIPPEAKSLNIRLTARSTRLLISAKQFTNSLLNHVLIKGNFNGGKGYGGHVEFLEEAFCKNGGTYPELEVVSVHTVVFKRRTFCQEFTLNVTSAAEVVVMGEAFSVTASEILLHGVKDIRIQDNAFRGSQSTKLEIVNSGIGKLFELRASFRQIQFINSTIEEISSKAFDVNKIDSLVFENCDVTVLKSQAITEKLLCKSFTMTHCRIGTIESKFIADSGLTNFIMRDNVINEIAADAIKFTGVSSHIIHNKIIKTGTNWFYQNSGWTSVIVQNNSFGEFNYFTLANTSSPEVCKFHANSVTQPALRSFSFFPHPGGGCVLSESSFNRQCTCDERWLKELYFQDYDKLLANSYCRIDETLRYCFNASTFNVKKYMDQVCDESTRTIDCSRSQKEKKVEEPDFVTPAEIESIGYDDYYQYVVYGVPVLVALVVGTLCFMFCSRCCRRQTADSGEVVSNASFTMTHKPSKAFTKEDKTIIHQTLQKIKDKQSAEFYEHIFFHTRKLLDGNSTETEKVLTIGEIVRRLNECENCGDDFVAFTDILYRHLAPSTSATPHEIIYAEPSAPAAGMTVLGTTPATAPDHIYAELTSAAQPLLINEYSAPMDLSDSHYSEPVQIMQKDNTRTLITPYAIGNNIAEAVQPGTSRNLPDILNSNNSGGGGSVASGSAVGEPLRYMDRSPTSSREIPEYTLPVKKVPPKPAPRRDAILAGDSDSSSSSSSNGSEHSEHSGGSDITVKIDDIVEYADA